MNAPTPPPHVPVAFLKAGGSSFFSAKCIALLLELGYHPDDFGSYNSVRNRLKQTREKVKTGQVGNTPGDAHDREFGEPTSNRAGHYQAGHLGMNAQRQTKRGDNCSNVVAGHDCGLYPCMPHQGSAMVQGTEHNRTTVREIDVARHGRNTNDPLPAETMSAEDDMRTQQQIAERTESLQEQGKGQNIGRMQSGTEAEKAQALAEAEQVRSKADPKEKLPEGEQISGDTAAECINNFRKGAENGMRKEVSKEDTIEKNENAALGKDKNGNPRPGMKPAKDGETSEEYQARLKKDWVNESGIDADTQAQRQRRLNSVRQANCNAQQGRELANDPNARLDGRTPSGWSSLPRDGSPRSNGTVL